VIVSLAGALMLILMGHGEGGTRSLKGNIFGVLSAISYACYLISIKKTSAKYKPITLLRWTFLSCSIMTIPFTLMQVEVAPIWHNAPTEPILLLASVILFPTFISYLLIPIAVKRIGHELVSMYQYLIPVVATAAAVIMKLDKLHWDQPIAAVIIVLGVYITSIANKRMINT
ncbi:MAG: DMT family transporter, partial [Bacteroidales bacterium]